MLYPTVPEAVQPCEPVVSRVSCGRPMTARLGKVLARYASLAPSNRNTQPWQFRVSEGRIDLLADVSRWLAAHDPDRRDLHVSLGCALENLLIAAEYLGLGHQTQYFPDPQEYQLAATVTLTHGDCEPTRATGLFDMIATRRTNRQPYQDEPVTPEDLSLLGSCCRERGVMLYLSTDEALRTEVGRLVEQADEMLFQDVDYRAELARCVGQGMLGDPWPLAGIRQFVQTHFDAGPGVIRRDTRGMANAPVIGVICSPPYCREAQMKAGQVLQRVWLTATGRGLQLQPYSQVLEVHEIKSMLGAMIPREAGLIPQQVFRLGHAPRAAQQAPRRPVADVVVDGE